MLSEPNTPKEVRGYSFKNLARRLGWRQRNPALWHNLLNLLGFASSTQPTGYENPGHHDPKGGGNVGYNSTKSVLPENHIELWNKSVIVKSDPKNRWAVETKNGKTIYHRFQDDGNGNFHWNGSTDGKTAKGEARAIKIDDVPKELKR